MLQRYLLLWLVLLSAAAFYWTDWFRWDPFVKAVHVGEHRTLPILNYLFAVTMLAIGSMLPRDEVRQVARRWPTVLAGTALQYASMPLLAFAVARVLGLEGAALVGILIAGCVPGAMASNVLTLIARGNVSYSVGLTTSATLLSPLCVPLALALTLGMYVDFPTAKVSWNLLWMVALPVVCGHLLSRRFEPWRVAARRVGPTVANLAILWIIAVVVGENRAQLSQSELLVPVAVVALNLLGYLTGYLGGRVFDLSAGMRRALTLEIGTQNAGLGTVLAMELFPQQPATAIPTALFTFVCMATGTALARMWATKDESSL